MTCCEGFVVYLVYAIHFIELVLGVCFCMVGSLIMQEGMHQVVSSFMLAYSAVLFYASILGLLGFYTPMCERCGLVMSGFVAPMIGITDVYFAIVLIRNYNKLIPVPAGTKDTFHTLLNDLDRFKVQIFFFLMILGIAEILRVFVSLKMRRILLQIDSNTRNDDFFVADEQTGSGSGAVPLLSNKGSESDSWPSFDEVESNKEWWKDKNKKSGSQTNWAEEP